jgi:hypothetical protein
MQSKQPRAFSFRAGVRLRDTILAFDAGAGSDLIFISHARAIDARAARTLPRPRAGRRQVLTTETTLALLGHAGERLRAHTLLAGYGRPFVLGELRLELFPSSAMPGAAALLCEKDGRRTVYAGPIGAGPVATRNAAALCLDAPFASRRFTFPERAAALAEAQAAVVEAAGQGRTPVLLVDPLGPAVEAGAALAGAGLALRGHRRVMAAAVAFRRAGLAVPAVQRFDGKLKQGEVLLWPIEARDAAMLRSLPDAWMLLASELAADPESVARLRVDRAVAFASHADLDGAVRYVEATGAAEVAILRAPDDELGRVLRERGVDTYHLGPPRQIALFAQAGLSS